MTELTHEEKCAIATEMRELDGATRSALIATSDNVIDRRGDWQRMYRNRELAASYRYFAIPEGKPA